MEYPAGDLSSLLLVFMLLESFTFIFTLVLQVVCAIHVFSRGREFWWLWVILLFPLVGAIVYLFVVVLPERNRGRGGFSLFSSKKRLVKQLEKTLLFSDTLANRKELANAYFDAGMLDKAAAAFEYCLNNGCESDQKMRLKLANTYFEQESYKKAGETLALLSESSDKELANQTQLLEARILENTEHEGKALKVYQELVKSFSGEEVRCRMALLLKKTGDKEKARKVFTEIIERCQHSPAFYARAQHQWLKIAKRNR